MKSNQEEPALVLIDIGSSGIRVLLAERSITGQLVALDTENISGTFLQDGLITNITLIQEKLKEVSKEIRNRRNLNFPPVYVNAGSGNSVFDNGEVSINIKDKVKEKDIKQLQKNYRDQTEAKWGKNYEMIHCIQQIARINGSLIVDNPLHMQANQLSMGFHSVGINKEFCENLRSCFHKTGLRIGGIVFNALAVSEALLSPEQKNNGVMIVDIGASTCDIAIYQQGFLTYTQSSAFGGQRLTAILAKELKSTSLYVDNLKQQYGACSPFYLNGLNLEMPNILGGDNQTVDKALFCHWTANFYKELGKEIAKIYRWVQHSCQGGIVLTGAGANVLGLKELMHGLLPPNTPVEIGVNHEMEDTEFAHNSAYSTLLGLLHYPSGMGQKDNAWQNFQKISWWDNVWLNFVGY